MTFEEWVKHMGLENFGGEALDFARIGWYGAMAAEAASDGDSPTLTSYQKLLSCAQRREPFRHLLDELPPCFEEEQGAFEQAEDGPVFVVTAQGHGARRSIDDHEKGALTFGDKLYPASVKAERDALRERMKELGDACEALKSDLLDRADTDSDGLKVVGASHSKWERFKAALAAMQEGKS